jgi:hypothetical protein
MCSRQKGALSYTTVPKGVICGDSLYTSLVQRVQKRLVEKISEINLPFEDELSTIEED